MAIFEPDKPINTKEPFVTVENKFEPGTYRFRLVVHRADGTRSQPVFQDVLIVPEGGLRRLEGRTLVVRNAAETETKETKTTKKTSKETKPTRKRARRGQGKRSNPNPEP